MSPLILYFLFEKHGRYILQNSEAAARNRSFKKAILKNFVKFIGKHPCQSLFFNKAAGLRSATIFKKGSGTSVFCKFCEISMKTFSYRTLPVAASENFSVLDKFWLRAQYIKLFA